MARITVRPTRADKAIADTIAAHTEPSMQSIAQALTWGADENLLLAAAVGVWCCTLRKPAWRPLANHFVALTLASAVLPHLLKNVVDQTRPDRLTVRGHGHGVPVSGKARDAFPSGHAMHMGALASAAGLLRPRPRLAVRLVTVLLSATRVVLLAHWVSDVVAGYALGALLERIMRPLTLRWPAP
jgi:membrane-associated phospholipid phosphatase